MSAAFLALSVANPGLLPLAIRGMKSCGTPYQRGFYTPEFIEAQVAMARLDAMLMFACFDDSAEYKRISALRDAEHVIWKHTLDYGLYRIQRTPAERRLWLKTRAKALVQHDRILAGSVMP